ncbi:ATP synthase F1 subunit delta [Neorickettsia findlayensis]|uniref:ATP synthase subunit delta n=1 Tax=Neorickettsia findlayensis TaxID=2686014 RepID=A0A6P1G9P0_9RICK|nr:ATP synthase F1 subunit delta [Neorickettsia findlayensis]QHD64953.1 ATP synthase F1 subunit delta [Neorickettsia findlayensis]
MQQYIAGRYAQSLYAVCGPRLESDVNKFLSLLSESNFLSFARIKTSTKVYVLDRLDLPCELRNLCRILLANHRGFLCTKVLLEYIEIVKRNRKEADARVEAYSRLSATAKKKVAGALLVRFPYLKKINIAQKVNRSLLGGLTIKINSMMIDLSIAGRLAKCKSMGQSTILKTFQ